MKRVIVCLIVIGLSSSAAWAATYGVKRTISIGGTGSVPSFLQYNARTNRMYCGNTGTAAGIRYIDCAADTLLGMVAGAAPGRMACDTLNNRVYLHDNGVNFYGIDCASNTLDTTFMMGQGGGPVDCNPVNNKIYHLDQTFSTVYAVNAATYADTSFNGAGGMLYYQPGDVLYTGQLSTDSLLIYSGATDARAGALSVPGLGASAKKMAANPAISRLYLALNSLDRVAIVNTATNTLLSSPLVGDNPADFALCPLNNKMFVACNGSNSRSLYAIDALGATDSVAVSDSLDAVAYNPADSLIYCADYNRGRIWMVDPRGASPVLFDSVSLGYTFARPAALAVDGGGDVYVAATGLDWVPVVGKMPARIWRSTAFGGTWFAPSSWEYSDDGGFTWGNPDSIYPSGVADSIITVQTGSTIQMVLGGPVVTVDQLVIDGTLVQTDNTLRIADGPGTDMAVNGIYQFIGGTLQPGVGATMAVSAGGTYIHGVDGGTVPTATWDSASTLRVAGMAVAAPAGLNQAFGDIIWDCSDQTVDATLPGGTAFALRHLQVANTGPATGRLWLTSVAVPSLTIGGDLILSSNGNAVLGGGGTRSVTVGGNFSIYDPSWLYLTDPATPGLSTLNLRGNYLHGVAGIAGGGPDSTTIAFCGSDTQTYSGNGEVLSGHVNYRVEPGAFLRINDFSYVGQNSLGWFRLMAGATLGLNDYQGLYLAGDSGAVRVAGARSYSQDASYYFYSFSTGPFPTGPGFPDTVRQLIVASPGDPVVLSKDLAVRDTLKLQSGPLRVGARRLSLLGAVQWAGGSLQADTTSRLAVLGNAPAPVLIPASITGLDTLVLDRAAGVNLGAPLPIRGAYVQRSGTILSNWLQYLTPARLVYEMAGADTTSDGEFPVSSGPRNVTVNTGGALLLHADRSVPGTLTLSQGALTTGAATVTVDSSGVLQRTAGFVQGRLAKYFWPSDTARTYELGTTGTGYAPVTLRAYGIASSGLVTAGITDTTHPNIANAGASLRKYWSFASAGIVADSFRIALSYAPGDFNPPTFTEAAAEGAMAAVRYDYGATPGWRIPAIAARNPGGSADGGSIVVSHAGLFGAFPDFALVKDTLALQQLAYSTAWLGGVYRLLSVPAVPAETTAVALLAGSLGAYSDSTWRMFGYDTQTAAYVERPAVHNGRAYWLASRYSATLQVNGMPTSGQTALRLLPGWNLLGDPYDTTLAVAAVQVAVDSGTVYPFDDVSGYVNDNLVRQRLWTYHDASPDLVNNGAWDSISAFDASGVMAPWQGYAVYAVAACSLRMNTAWKSGGDGRSTPPDPGISWQLRVDAECGRGADRGVTLGIAERAREGYDRLDAEKPPLVCSEISAVIPHPDWRQGPCSEYHYDYRPPAGRLEWPLLVRQNDPTRPGRLLFRASGALPGGQRAYLADRRLGTAVAIVDGAVIGFSGSREFAVICGDGIGELGLKPLALALERPSPNPSAGAAAIGFQLPRPGPVSLKVYNVAGQLVRTLADGVRDAGYYSVRWDGRNDQLLASSAGLYVIRLVGDGESRTEKLVRLR